MHAQTSNEHSIIPRSYQTLHYLDDDPSSLWTALRSKAWMTSFSSSPVRSPSPPRTASPTPAPPLSGRASEMEDWRTWRTVAFGTPARVRRSVSPPRPGLPSPRTSRPRSLCLWPSSRALRLSAASAPSSSSPALPRGKWGNSPSSISPRSPSQGSASYLLVQRSRIQDSGVHAPSCLLRHESIDKGRSCLRYLKPSLQGCKLWQGKREKSMRPRWADLRRPRRPTPFLRRAWRPPSRTQTAHSYRSRLCHLLRSPCSQASPAVAAHAAACIDGFISR